MPFKRTKAELHLSWEDRDYLEKIHQTRTEEVRRVERTSMLLLYANNISVSIITERLDTTPPRFIAALIKPWRYEVWTTRLLAQHIEGDADDAGRPSVNNIGSGTVSRILDENDIKPHKVNYYLERRDPDFDTKMAHVLHIYQQVEWMIEDNAFQPVCDVMLSYDEKPGI
ncbi:hypothetical protein [Salinicoccus albus]|uniref:hypothetical protein n=1 Tax=Salinicoccus albus TaxID=418756 RepID=UPI00035F8E22|nr:hypothetical protein [Salinicoccus albus]